MHNNIVLLDLLLRTHELAIDFKKLLKFCYWLQYKSTRIGSIVSEN